MFFSRSSPKYNSISASGSSADQNVNILPKGSGKVGIGTTAPNGMLSFGPTWGTKIDFWNDGYEAIEMVSGTPWELQHKFHSGGDIDPDPVFVSGH